MKMLNLEAIKEYIDICEENGMAEEDAIEQVCRLINYEIKQLFNKQI
jgi:hypothetical protein